MSTNTAFVGQNGKRRGDVFISQFDNNSWQFANARRRTEMRLCFMEAEIQSIGREVGSVERTSNQYLQAAVAR